MYPSNPTGGSTKRGDTENEALRRPMWRMVRFSGLEIQTYAVMDNRLT